MITIILLFGLNGCGGGGGSSSGNGGTGLDVTSNGPAEIEMQEGKTYTVYPGDKIVKTTDNAEVTIVHIDGHPESSVTLIAGDAKIIRK